MESLLYITAVLASLADKTANSPNVVAKVVQRLYQLNVQLHMLSEPAGPYDDFSAVLRTQVDLMTQAGDEVAKLPLSGHVVAVYYNHETPAGHPGSRIRLEISDSSWDSGAPLYFEIPESAAPVAWLADGTKATTNHQEVESFRELGCALRPLVFGDIPAVPKHICMAVLTHTRCDKTGGNIPHINPLTAFDLESLPHGTVFATMLP